MRHIINPFNDQSERVQATARTEAVAAVDNSTDGVCPKCRKQMGFASIAVGRVFYCSGCRVALPIAEG